MNCRDATDFLMDYVARELAPEVCGEFELHLSRCSNCRVFLIQYRETILAGRRACAEDAADARTELPDEMVQAIMAALRKATPEPR